MNEKMNEKLLNREMYFNMLDLKFKELMDYKNCFRSEILDSEFNNYYTDAFDDNLKLLIFINDNFSGKYYIDEKTAVKIMKHIESVDLLMRDTRHYLCIKKGTSNFFSKLENYKKGKEIERRL